MTTLLALALAAGAGQTVERAGVTARAAVEPDAVALVGTVTLTLTVEADAPLSVESVRYAAPSGWTIVETVPGSVEALPANRARWRASFRLSPERPGELPLPPPALKVRAAGRQSVTDIAWEPFAVRVETTLAGATLDEAKGVAGPIRPPDEPASYVGWLVAVGTIAALAAVLLARRRRSSPPAISPEDEARARLAVLVPLDVNALDAVLRHYLNRRGVAADRLTTTELAVLCRVGRVERFPPRTAESLTVRGGTRSTRPTLQVALQDVPFVFDSNWVVLFHRCDLARYAGQPFDAGEWEQIVAQAQSLIPASLPVGETAPVAGSGGNASSCRESAADTSDN